MQRYKYEHNISRYPEICRCHTITIYIYTFIGMLCLSDACMITYDYTYRWISTNYAYVILESITQFMELRIAWLNEGGCLHDDVIKWKHFSRYWPFVRGIHRSPVNSPYRGQWRGAFMFSLIWAWINRWVNNREADNLRRYRAHYDVIVMSLIVPRYNYKRCP